MFDIIVVISDHICIYLGDVRSTKMKMTCRIIMFVYCNYYPYCNFGRAAYDLTSAEEGAALSNIYSLGKSNETCKIMQYKIQITTS